MLATGAEDEQIRVIYVAHPLTCAKAENIQIWDIAGKNIVHIFNGHQEIYLLDFLLDGHLIVSGSGDEMVRIWDMFNPEAPPKVGHSHSPFCTMIIDIYPGPNHE